MKIITYENTSQSVLARSLKICFFLPFSPNVERLFLLNLIGNDDI